MKSLIVAVILLFATTSVHAVQLRQGHPNEVIVTRGDTLWDISGRFLRHPWEWPKLWRANPGIKNPHLIYPGDKLTLRWKNGQPWLSHNRGKRYGSAIPTMNYQALKKFMSRPHLIDPETFDNAGYLVAFGNDSLIASKGATAYARKLDRSASDFVIVRPWKNYKDPDTGQIIGKGSLYVGSARVKRHGDPSTLVITDSAMEIMEGDKLIPASHDRNNLHHHPSSPANSVRGEVIDVINGYGIGGQYTTVAIDKGAEDGLKPGNVLKISSSSYIKRDWKSRKFVRNTEFDNPEATYDREGTKRWYDVKEADPVDIPEESAGQLIVYRVYDNISFGMITDSYNRQVRVGYPVHSP